MWTLAVSPSPACNLHSFRLCVDERETTLLGSHRNFQHTRNTLGQCCQFPRLVGGHMLLPPREARARREAAFLQTQIYRMFAKSFLSFTVRALKRLKPRNRQQPIEINNSTSQRNNTTQDLSVVSSQQARFFSCGFLGNRETSQNDSEAVCVLLAVGHYSL